MEILENFNSSVVISEELSLSSECLSQQNWNLHNRVILCTVGIRTDS